MKIKTLESGEIGLKNITISGYVIFYDASILKHINYVLCIITFNISILTRCFFEHKTHDFFTNFRIFWFLFSHLLETLIERFLCRQINFKTKKKFK